MVRAGIAVAATLGIFGVVAVVRTVGREAHGGERSYATAVGEQAVLTLRDGSRVTLAPRSRLTVSDGFGAAARTVTLSGEAYFDVVTSAGAPFVVRSGSAVARVLGTRFNVRHYTGDRSVQVAVASGRVRVERVSRTPVAVVLSAGSVATVNDSAVSRRDSGSAPTWMTGTIAFHEALASDVLAEMSRWYGYEFRYADSTLGSRNLTMVLDTHSPAQSLSALKVVLDVDLTFDGNVVTLHPRTAGRAPARHQNNTRDAFPHFPREVGR